MAIWYWHSDDDQFSGSGIELTSAEALVVSWRIAAGKPNPGECVCVAECYFWGENVPLEIDGVLQTLEVVSPIDWTIAQWKNSLLNAVQARATELGLIVVAGNIRLPTFELGS